MKKNVDILNNWEYPYLRDLVVSQKGKKPNFFSYQPEEGFIPYLDIKALETGIVEKYAEKESSNILDADSIAVVWDGSRSGWIEKGKHGAIGSTILKILPFELSLDYLFYFLKYNYSYLNVNTRGTGVPHVDPEVFWKIRVPLPPINEQPRIVEEIDKLFKSIERAEESLKNALFQLTLFRQSLLQKAFTGQLTKEWRKEHQPESANQLVESLSEQREQYYEEQLSDWEQSVVEWEQNSKEGRKPTKPRSLKSYNTFSEKDISELPELPESWTWVKLGQMAEIIGGVTKGRRLIGRETIHVPYLRVANVQDGYLDLIHVKEIEVLPEDLTKYQLEAGDVLYIEGGDKDKLGRGTVWNNELPTCIHQNHVFRARMISKILTVPQFVAYNSQTQVAKKYFFRNAKQTVNLASINMTVLSELPVPLCSGSEQQEILKRLEELFLKYEQLKYVIESTIKDIEPVRQSILKKAFEGRLVAQDPNDEPASELLKRIALEKKEWEKLQKSKKKSRKPQKRMESLTIEEVLRKAKEPISPKELWESSKHKHDIEEFYLELKKLGDRVVEIKSETDSLMRLEDAS